MVNNQNILKRMENEYEILGILFSEREPITSGELLKKVRNMKRTAFFDNLKGLVKKGLLRKGYQEKTPIYSLTSEGREYYSKDPWRLISHLLPFKTYEFGEKNNSGLYEDPSLGLSFNIYESDVNSNLNGGSIRDSIVNLIYKEIKKALVAKTFPEIKPESRLILALEIDYNKMHERIKKLRAFKEDLNSRVSLIFRDDRLGFYKEDKKGQNLRILNDFLDELTNLLGKDIKKQIDNLLNYISDNKDEFLSFIGEAIDKDLLNKVISDIKDNINPLDDSKIADKLLIIEYNRYNCIIDERVFIYLLVARYILHKNKTALARIEKFEKEVDKKADAKLEEMKKKSGELI